jgi:hypothetical protein
MKRYEVMLAKSAIEAGEVRTAYYEADTPQEAYDKAAQDGFVMEVVEVGVGSVVDEINMWQ